MYTTLLHRQKVSLANGSHLLATTHLASTYSERAVQDGQAFEVAAEAYIKAYLDRGAPSLFSTLKPLYRQAAASPLPIPLHPITLPSAACTVCWTDTRRLPQVPAEGVRSAASMWQAPTFLTLHSQPHSRVSHARACCA